MKKFKQEIFKIVFIVFGFGFSFAYLGAAQITIDNPLSCDDVGCVISKIIDGLTMLAIPLLVIMVLIGGFQILFSGGNEEKIKTGKKTLWYAVLGYIIILLANGIDLIIKSILEVK
jgi:hypothetical protein